MNLEMTCSPRLPEKNIPANTLILVFWDFKQTNQSNPQDFWTTEPWDKFKSFHLGEFVKAVIENKYREILYQLCYLQKKKNSLDSTYECFQIPALPYSSCDIGQVT